MAELAAVASIAGAVTGLGGSLAGAAGQRVSGSLEKTRKYLEAQELRRKAVDVEGVADKKIANMQDEAARVLSAQQAAAASQGFDAADTGITDLQGKVAAKATRAQMYERNAGIQQAADLILGAGRSEAAGDAAKRAASVQSLGTIIGGVGQTLNTVAGKGIGESVSGFSKWLTGKQGASTAGGWRGGDVVAAGGTVGEPLNIMPPGVGYG